MAHNLLGGRMAFVDEVPWHGLGEQVPPTATSREMCEAAGLDWAVEKVPAPGARVTDPGKEVYERYLIMRDAIDEETERVALGMVGPGYEPVQNADAFTFFEPLIDDGYATFHTAGALGNGERIWVLAKLGEQIIVHDDDVVDRFLLLSNSHDGSGAVTIRFTPIRVVCQNTLNFALKGGSGVISVRHSRHVARNLLKAQADNLKMIIEKQFLDAASLFGMMALRSIKDRNVSSLLDNLFPRTRLQTEKGTRPERWDRVMAVLANPSVTPPKTAGTLWAVYNAIVREEDYRATRERSEDARLGRVWFGAGSDLKLKLLAACRSALAEAA